MATHFDNFQRAASRIVPDFNRLKVGPHPMDPRAAASIVIAGMILGLSLMLAFALSPPARVGAPAKSAEKVAPPPEADKVTIVSAKPRVDVPCAEQTWPYIDKSCLTATTEKRAVAPKSEAKAADVPVPPIDARSATAPVAPVVNATTAPVGEPLRPAIAPSAPNTSDSRAAYSNVYRDDVNEEIDQNELEDEANFVPPPVAPRDQFRREQRRYSDPGRQMARQWREFRRVFTPF